jgi:hypothetical protein
MIVKVLGIIIDAHGKIAKKPSQGIHQQQRNHARVYERGAQLNESLLLT